MVVMAPRAKLHAAGVGQPAIDRISAIAWAPCYSRQEIVALAEKYGLEINVVLGLLDQVHP